jgi:hypothetical protein
MTPLVALAELEARTADELAALEAGDLDALKAATQAKMVALAPLRALDGENAADLPRAALMRAAAQNREAARTINIARARVERRLAALARAGGRDPATAYGPDGRLRARVLRP